LFGGKDGIIPYVNIQHPDGIEEKKMKASAMPIKANTIITTYTGGGGGFEPPLERDANSVLYDVINKYVTIERAKEDYGVIINNKFEINNEETLKLRNQKNS